MSCLINIKHELRLFFLHFSYLFHSSFGIKHDKVKALYLTVKTVQSNNDGEHRAIRNLLGIVAGHDSL